MNWIDNAIDRGRKVRDIREAPINKSREESKKRKRITDEKINSLVMPIKKFFNQLLHLESTEERFQREKIQHQHYEELVAWIRAFFTQDYGVLSISKELTKKNFKNDGIGHGPWREIRKDILNLIDERYKIVVRDGLFKKRHTILGLKWYIMDHRGIDQLRIYITLAKDGSFCFIFNVDEKLRNQFYTTDINQVRKKIGQYIESLYS